MKRMDWDAFSQWARGMRRPYHARYLAMYSSVFGGVVTDPALMLLPMDDHMVHRGDGVFEAFKCVRGRIYNLKGHLDRLYRSLAQLSLEPPVSREQLTEQVLETIGAAGAATCEVRLFVSRGPGSFGVNPYDSPQAQIYIVICTLKDSFMALHPQGARGCSTTVPQKDPFFARIKSVNYLPNVLMRKEAVDHGVDLVVAFDENGHLTEGATENLGVVTRGRELLFPRIDTILSGTTMLRVMELARELVPDGALAHVGFADIPRDELLRAAEVLVVGTTWDVSAMTEYDGTPVGDGKPGPVALALNRLLQDDILTNTRMQTPVACVDPGSPTPRRLG